MRSNLALSVSQLRHCARRALRRFVLVRLALPWNIEKLAIQQAVSVVLAWVQATGRFSSGRSRS